MRAPWTDREHGGRDMRLLPVAAGMWTAALAAAPRVLILDEPTFGQDRRTWMQIVRLIHSLRSPRTFSKDLGTAVL